MVGANFHQRGAHVEEAIALIKTLWRETPASFYGSMYQLNDAYFYPNPEGDGPPVWIGGSSPVALSRAARLGDGWMPFWGEWEAFTSSLGKFKNLARELRASERGRSIRIAANVPVRIASDRDAADASQTEDQVISVLREYRNTGMETVIWNIQSEDLDDYLRQIRLLAERILPALESF